MKLVAEISLYPLSEDYIPPIKDFIARLNQYPQLQVKTSATSTLVAGEYGECFTLVGKEMQRTHKAVGQAIFVCKFLNGDNIDLDYHG